MLNDRYCNVYLFTTPYNTELPSTASIAKGNDTILIVEDETETMVYDLICELDDGEISTDDLRRLTEAIHTELWILEPGDEMIAAIKGGNRLFCAVSREEHKVTHSAFNLRLSGIWIDSDGAPSSYDMVRLPLSATDSVEAGRLINEMMRKHIMPLAETLAELYGQRRDDQFRAVMNGKQANA